VAVGGTGVFVLVGVKVAVGLVPFAGGITRSSISLGCRVREKFELVAKVVPAMDAKLVGAGFTFPLMELLGASWGAPLEEVPEGSMIQALLAEAGLNPEMEIVAVSLDVGLLLTK